MRLAIVLAGLSAIYPVAFADIDPPEGYGLHIPEWDVEITPGGERVTLNGTVEEVREELLRLNPRWNDDFLEGLPDESEHSTLVKRTDFYGAKYVCGRWSGARHNPIVDGIKYLRGISGRPGAGPGPGNCGRVSCSYDSAIWWCNDSPKSKQLRSYGSIADGAQYVVQHCTITPSGSSFSSVTGQAFHKTDWNVIVRGANC
ncbi:hypothetical protein BDW59DRAFT_171895 [Aspergillus cavernicola]|uniref:Secreted protein n=1 Tax=Aspergillus cavernicola TaxID=176166 RepID=A0ABR4IEQ7_9EURO